MNLLDFSKLPDRLPVSENNDLAIAAKTSPDKMEEFILRNMKLAVSYVVEMGIPITEDVIQSAAVGLMLTVHHYDKKRGSASTCAKFWVRNEIFLYLNNENPIHYSHSFSLDKRKYEKLISNAAKANIDTNSKEFQFCLESNGLTKKKIKDIQNIDYSIGSYDDGHMEIEIYEFPDDKDDKIYRETLAKDVREALYTLSSKEKETLERFFGIDCDPESLSRIAESRNVTRQAIGFLKSSAFKKLKENERLKGYVGK